MSTFMPVPYHLDYYNFVICFIIQDYFGYSGSLGFSCKFSDELVNFCKEARWEGNTGKDDRRDTLL